MNDNIISQTTIDLLNSEAKRINSPVFIKDDPVQFPRRFSDLRDIEIVSLLVATISWGKRTMICTNAERLLSMMDNSPYQYMMDDAAEMLAPQLNIHRTFFASHLNAYLKGLKKIYSRYASLNDFCKKHHIGEAEAPAWEFASLIGKAISEANWNQTCGRCIPNNLDTTALKRINMAFRWLVRNDGIVDMGVWTNIPPSSLYIPLDVHSAATSRSLGLLKRKSNDKKAVFELTSQLKKINPTDPAIFDYALFGIGMGL